MTDGEPRAAGDDPVGREAAARQLLLDLWAALPAFLVSGSLLCLIVGALLWLVPWPGPLLPPLLAVLAGPVYVALVEQAVEAIDGDTPRALSILRSPRAHLATALRLLLPAGAATSLALVALLVWTRTGSVVWMLPAGVCCSVAVLLAIAAVAGAPLVARTPELRGRRLIVAALAWTARHPVRLLGVIAVAVIAGWAASELSGTLLFLLPAPFAVVSAVATATGLMTPPGGSPHDAASTLGQPVGSSRSSRSPK